MKNAGDTQNIMFLRVAGVLADLTGRFGPQTESAEFCCFLGGEEKVLKSQDFRTFMVARGEGFNRRPLFPESLNGFLTVRGTNQDLAVHAGFFRTVLTSSGHDSSPL